MEIKRNDNKPFILIKASCEGEFSEVCYLAYLELDEKTILNWFELREDFLKLKEKYEVYHIAIPDAPFWFDGIPDELRDLYEIVYDEEYSGVTQIPQDFLDKHKLRIESDEAHINEWGVTFYGNVKYSNERIYTESLSWLFIEECLKNCYPNSFNFIKDLK
jgi:hypothetical protein